MIKVLHSVSNMDRAGIETMLMNYYRHIDKNKVQFVFLCNKSKIGAYNDEIIKMGGKIYVSPGYNPLKIFQYGKLVKRILLENPEIKIVHAHNGPLQFFALYFAKKYGIKIRISHAHSTKVPYSNKYFDLGNLYKRFLKSKLKRVANYYWGCGLEAVRFYYGKKVVKNKNYEIIRNAVDTSLFSFKSDVRIEERKKLNISEDCFVIGHIGRFNIVKNQSFLLKVFKEVLNIEKNSKLLFIGDGELEDKVKNEAKKLGIDNSVIFAGNVKDAYNKYQIMDVFVLPSIFEGLPVVGVEAQANGLYCVFSDSVSHEVDITGNTTFLSLNEDYKTWAKALLNKKERDKDAIKKIEINGYSIAKESKKLEEKYLDLVKKID